MKIKETIKFEIVDGAFPFEVNEYHQFSILTKEGLKHYQITRQESGYKRDTYEHGWTGWVSREGCFIIKIEAISIDQLTVKTKEEKLAEETVKAAKEALSKAEKTLKAVRDSK